ncbi:hypothetical protein FHL15_003385 [Xylaria flabelliformis]|uniref:Uncharacterized protein n=1 Tax=Xylaria flabelliformis TaxID=2512241 RepID=A0A553I6L0_9PEZI|nr:hypothetical protein FHL15_003385 [Xylaria flabelliformis]
MLEYLHGEKPKCLDDSSSRLFEGLKEENYPPLGPRRLKKVLRRQQSPPPLPRIPSPPKILSPLRIPSQVQEQWSIMKTNRLFLHVIDRACVHESGVFDYRGFISRNTATVLLDDMRSQYVDAFMIIDTGAVHSFKSLIGLPDDDQVGFLRRIHIPNFLVILKSCSQPLC